MNPKEIRWKQRFVNFEKAFLQLENAMDRFESLDDLSKEGLVQRFEFSLELAWKTLKDYLEYQGIIAKSPRETIKEGFKINILDDGEIWMNMLEDSHLMAHTYDEKIFKQVVADISDKYYERIKALYLYLKTKDDK